MSNTPTKGHWPKGRRRNADNGDWSVVLLGVKGLLDEYEVRGKISIRALAKAVGVDPKAVMNWLGGIDRPDEEMQITVRAWLKQMRAWVKTQRWE